MMNPEDNESAEELEAVPSDMFDSSPSPVSGLGGWATGAGSALFAVTKGVSSRVEGVSSRMSLRAKDMLASVGDDPDGDGNTVNGSGSPVSAASPNGSQRNGEGAGNGNVHGDGNAAGSGSVRNGSLRRFFHSNGGGAASASGILSGIANDANSPPSAPTVDEGEVSRLVSSLNASPQLAEKMVAMNKLSSVLGDGAGKCSQSILRSVAVPLVVALRDAEHFDPFFANACIACTQQLLEAQGGVFATELVEEGAVQALIPLLHPRFELIRIEGLAFLEALLMAERGRVCAQLVGVPAGMQALVDLLDDRWDEVRHQTVTLLAAFLTGDGGVPPPVDLQNFVAFQDGFEKLFKSVAFDEQATGDVSLRALAALTGTVTNNPLSRKLFLAGGHLSRLPALLTVLRPGEVSEHPLVQPQQAAASTHRRWGWGGGRDKRRAAAAAAAVATAAAASRSEGHAYAVHAGVDQAAASSSSPALEEGVQTEGERGRWSGKVPVARIRAALSLLSAVCGCGETGATTAVDEARIDGRKHGFATGKAVENPTAAAAAAAAREARSAVGRERGLFAAVCELALASFRAPAGGGPTWADYGLPEDCQRSAMEVLATLIEKHPENQAFLAACKVRGAPISVTVHGQKQLISSEPRNAVDVFLELWLAASSAMDEGLLTSVDGEGVGKTSSIAAEVAALDRALDAFLIGNTSWCETVLTGVSVAHATAARLSSGGEARLPASSPGPSRSSSGGRGDDPASGRPDGPSSNGSRSSNSLGVQNGGGGRSGAAAAGDGGPTAVVGGVTAMSVAMKRGLLCVQPSSPSSSSASSSSGPASTPLRERVNSGGGGGGGGGGGDSGAEREGDDEPLAAALRLRLLRRVLQAGGADARALAASVGLPTEGSRRQAAREQAHQDGREKAMQQGSGGSAQGALSPDELEGTLGEGPSWEDGELDGKAARERERGGGREGRVRGGPPLTPALEVAVRLLADGYKCAVMLQTSGPDPVNSDNQSPPSDLTHYLISLGELVVTWLSPEGVGPALSQRLLASGSTWALLRTIGRAFRPDLSPRRVKSRPENRRHRDVAHDLATDSSPASPSAASCAAAAASASRLSDDPSFAYLRALVAVIVGSFMSAGRESLASGTLSGGIGKHVGVFEFCRILDAASDWVSFAWPSPAGSIGVAGEGERTSPVPAFWALAGDCVFSGGVVEIARAAQAAMIEQIVAGGLGPKSLPAALQNGADSAQRRSVASRVRGAVPAEATADERTLLSSASEQGGIVGRFSTEDDGGGRGQGAGVHEDVDGTGSRGALGELLRRQQARIEELERRLLPPERAEAAAAAVARDGAAANAAEGCEHPTLTI